MSDFFGRLFDATDFVPRQRCGDWGAGLVWLHRGSDLFVWLAYLSIPAILLFFARERRAAPLRRFFWLFAAFILACGFTHFLDAMMFTWPAYRLSGLVKLITAVVSWATVLALIPAVPALLAQFDRVQAAPPVPQAPRAARDRATDYLVALGAAALAVGLRALLDRFLDSDYPYMFPILAVIFVAWYAGFWPGVVTLLTSMTGVLYFFVEPRYSFTVASQSGQLGAALFFFTGVACAMLGQAQHSARRRAEDALAEALRRQEALQAEVARRVEVESQFRTMADSIPQLAWMARPDGQRFWYNQRWYDYTGTTPEQMEGEGWQAVHHPAELPRMLQKFNAHLASGEPWEDTYPLRGRDGTYRWFLSRARPVRDESGRVVRWFGTNTDIEDRRQLAEDLRQSGERFRLLTEALPGLVWTASPSGEVTYFNQRWVDYTGVAVEQARGEGWREVIHPDDVSELTVNWREAVRTGRPAAFEYRIRRSDGEYRWHLSYAVPLRDASGAVVQWVGVITDIDGQRRQAETLERLVRERTAKLREEIEERVKAEAKVKEMMAELRRSNGELEQFAYVASHDLQEPLRKIQAFGDRLAAKSGERLDEQGRDYLERMKNSAARMQQLINDLLTYSRVSTRGQEFRTVDLAQTAKEVLSDLEARILQTGGEVRIGPLPAVTADAVQMRQLLQNLIGNALKFHRPDAPPLVTVSGRILPGEGRPAVCEVEVADNGIGFEEQYLDRIFQMFQRLHGRGVYEGTGVGLAICKKIVERHGGTISARSKPGEGATFLVTLPVGGQGPEARDQEAGGTSPGSPGKEREGDGANAV